MSEAVSEWEKNKIEQRKKMKERLKHEAQKKTEEERAKDEKNMQVSAALVAWETEKNELVTKRRERKRLEKEAMREVEKKKQAAREEADMVLSTRLAVFFVGHPGFSFRRMVKFCIH